MLPDVPRSGHTGLVGRSIGHYRIDAFLGAGSMGEVYLAHDTRLGRNVALKLLPAEFTKDPERLQRFEREARAASALNHPNIVTIHEIGHDGGTHYIAAEFIDGRSLRSRLGQPLKLAEALDIAIQVARALGAAHDAGVVHRDIKPDNIMIRPDGYVKVLDFGLAKLVGLENETMPPGAPVTQTGAVMGTVRYMSPEQVRGSRLDERTDLFSLGVTLYEMIAGQSPFPGATTGDVIVSILEREPPPLAQTRTDVPAELEHIVRKVISKPREERYSSAATLAAALETVRGSLQRLEQGSAAPTVQGVGASPDSVAAQRRTDSGLAPSNRGWRRTAVVFAMALILLALLVPAGGRLWQEWRASRPGDSAVTRQARQSVAVLGFRNLSGLPEADWISTALSEMLTTELAAGERLRTISGETVARMKTELSLVSAESLAGDTLDRIRTNLGANFVILGSYFAGKDAGGRIRWDLRVQDAAAGEIVVALVESGTEADIPDLVSRAGRHVRETLGAGAELTPSEAASVAASRLASAEANRLYAEGLGKLRLYEPLEARVLLERAVAADPASAVARAALAEAWKVLGYDGEARSAARAALELSAGLRREERFVIEASFHEAIKDFPKAVEIWHILFRSYPDDLEYGLRLAAAQAAAGKPSEGLETVHMMRTLPPPVNEDPRIDLAEAAAAMALSDYRLSNDAAARAAQKAEARGAQLLFARGRAQQGLALQRLGEIGAARAVVQEAKTIFEALGDHLAVARTLNALGIFSWLEGDLAGAKAAYTEALAICRRIGNRAGIGQGLQNLAIVLYDQGDLAGARRLYEQALEAYREAGDKAGAASTLNSIANVVADQGNHAAARRMYEEALAAAQQIGDRSNSAIALSNLAILQAEQGDMLAALESFEEAADIKRSIGNRSSLAYTLASLGETLVATGDLRAARQAHEEALAIRVELGQESNAAESRLGLAVLLLEEGRHREAEHEARAAREVLQRSGKPDLAAAAGCVLARALLAQGQLAAARTALDEAQTLLAKGNNLVLALGARIASSRLASAEGRVGLARDGLRRVIEEAGRSGLVVLQMEARLALAEAELRAGKASAARTQLAALEGEARSRGLELIARKAAVLGR